MMRIKVISILLLMTASSIPAQVTTLDRDRDPVVITGIDLSLMLGLPVNEVVAFRYQGGWQQIPVQIDERKVVDYGIVYNTDPVSLYTTAYADSSTYTGPDDDPAFDGDDELVFMAKDGGDRAGVAVALPMGVVSGTGLEITIDDPVDGGQGYVYLFRTDGTLSPGAVVDYITYTFNLLAGSYIPNYSTMNGPNPEDSEAYSAHYRTHFSDRWIRDELNVLSGSSSGADILDRHKNMFGPGICQRTENTFSAGEGAFFVNKDGAVRAIRSYMGANSGPLTQREHIFYEQRQDITTFLRVHPIQGVMDVYDYSPDAAGMTYYNDLNLGGVLVDGIPDVVTAGQIVWEMVTGVQGSLIVSHYIETDIDPFDYTLYYSDDSSPSVTQCTGDAYEYATSGVWINHVIPNTDPSQGLHYIMNSRRIVYYEPPGQTTTMAELRHSRAQNSLQFSVLQYPTAPPDFDRDGDVDLDDFDHFQSCSSGPAIPQTDPDCQDADLENDGDVDQNDFGLLQLCYSGTGNPADPDCGD
ncbi:MAG: hypothetical protein ACYTBZ_04585 [Planctomycetota bacterium]|jgi:hypothetical protein